MKELEEGENGKVMESTDVMLDFGEESSYFVNGTILDHFIQQNYTQLIATLMVENWKGLNTTEQHVVNLIKKDIPNVTF